MKEKLEVGVGGLAESCSLRWRRGGGGGPRKVGELGGREEGRGEGGGEFLRGKGVGTLGKRTFHSPL